MNKFIFTGNLTADPELQHTREGRPFAKFIVAVTRPHDRDKSDFFRCTTWGKQAENLAKYQKKGNKLGVEGEVHIDEKDGKYYTNVSVSQVEYLTPAKNNGGSSSGSGDFPPEPGYYDGADEGDPGDLPF